MNNYSLYAIKIGYNTYLNIEINKYIKQQRIDLIKNRAYFVIDIHLLGWL